MHPLRTGIGGLHHCVLTAAGADPPDLETGSVMVLDDQLNLTGRSPLVGPSFVDMVDAYSPTLRKLALATPDPAAAARPQRPGIYVQVPGPQLETPAEIRMLPKAMGADVVGMSIVLQTIVAREAGVDLLGPAVRHQPRRLGRDADEPAGWRSPRSGRRPPPPWPPSSATS